MNKLMHLAPNYKKLISLSEEFHCVLTSEGEILMFNEILLKTLKTESDKLKGVPFKSIVAKDSIEDFNEIWNNVVKSNRKHTAKLSMCGKGGLSFNTYWRMKSDLEAQLVYVVGTLLPDEMESEQSKLSRALNFLDKDLSKSNEEGFPLTDIQRVLSEKVDKFKLISQNVSDLVCLHDPITTQYLYASPSVTELTGYLPEELVGKTPFDLFHPEFLEKLEQDRQRSEQGEDQGPPPKMEVMFKTKDGDAKWIEAHSRPIFDEEGNVLLILSTSRDVSERKKAELEKEIYFNYYKTLGNNIPNGAVFLIDRDYRFIIAEGEEFEKVGRTSDYYVGKTISQVYDKTRLDFLKPYFEKVVHGEHVKFEYPYNGQQYVFLGSPGRDKEGNVVAGVFLTQNITETKQFQDLLKQTIYQLDFHKKALDAAALVSETDTEGILTYVNDKYVETSKYSENELIGNHYSMLKSGFHSRDFYDKIWKQISSGKVWNGEIKTLAKNSEFVWLDTCIVPFKDQNEEITKYVFIRFDISDKKAVQEKLEVKNFELDSFAYHTSHDLRAPLASILGLTGLIDREGDIDKIKEMNALIEQSVLKQDDFIKSILTYSQNKNLGSLVNKINFDDLLSGVQQELSNMLNADKVEIVHKIDIKSDFYSDSIRLMIVFKNLISNAIKYCDTNKKKSILNIQIEADSKECKIEFKDNGIGIKAEYVDNIFDMFYRATESSEGNGLGLYIVNETIEKLGGSIAMSSVDGEGTKFNIILKNFKP